MVGMTHSEVVHSILSTEVTEEQQEAAARFLNMFGSTTTAVFALAQALGSMNPEDCSLTEAALNKFVPQLAEIEASEM